MQREDGKVNDDAQSSKRSAPTADSDSDIEILAEVEVVKRKSDGASMMPMPPAKRLKFFDKIPKESSNESPMNEAFLKDIKELNEEFITVCQLLTKFNPSDNLNRLALDYMRHTQKLLGEHSGSGTTGGPSEGLVSSDVSTINQNLIYLSSDLNLLTGTPNNATGSDNVALDSQAAATQLSTEMTKKSVDEEESTVTEGDIGQVSDEDSGENTEEISDDEI